ncbi:tetratricopeptide repeat protein 21B-like [Planoprotostelium fungivorum]|uniref:Tetratricopeptide repeat protein 21B-like n=1 Tax=Planoprotostelium fungivorum TaxID=1890364 RepID=A0A2P6N1M8_9EUKA|nr:tetratricopeptide repeat protein 21B-like [Planoprotostelium fungivorum]
MFEPYPSKLFSGANRDLITSWNMTTETQSLINFYAREKYWRHIQIVCNEGLRKRGDDPTLIFWKAFGILMEGSTGEAIRDLDSIKNKRDLSLAAASASLHAQTRFTRVDREAVAELNARIKEETKAASEVGLLNAATFHWHMGEYDKSREYLKLILESQPKYAPAHALLGWVDLTCGRQQLSKKSINHFEKSISSSGSSRNIEAMLGKAKFFEVNGQYLQAIELLNAIVVNSSNFTPALTEKTKVLLMMGDWEQSFETATRVLQSEPNNVEALRFIVLYHLCQESKVSTAANKIETLIQALDRYEPKNAGVYLNCAKPFSRLAGRNAQILQQTLTLADRARSLQSDGSAYHTEYGHQQLLLGNIKEALMSYRHAINLQAESEAAFIGSIKCQILENQLEEAQKQFQFMAELQSSYEDEQKSSELIFLNALLVWRVERDQDRAVQLLGESLELHFRSLTDLPLSFEYFNKFNPDFLVEVAKEYLQFCIMEPIDPNDIVPPILSKAMGLLEIVSKAVPGQLECLYLLSKIRYVINEDDVAMKSIENCIRLNPAFTEAHLLQSLMYLKQDKPKVALNSLEQALSHDFDVKDTAYYHLINARIHEKLGEREQAVAILETAMDLPGVKTAAAPATARSKKKGSGQVTLYDRVSIFLELAKCYTKQNLMGEAQKIFNAGDKEFMNTPEEVRIIIGSAEFASAQGDHELALTLLGQVTNDRPYFVKAQTVMAGIYLTTQNDKRMYINCYRRLQDSNPNLQTSLMLGDAYMKIQEPVKAINVYLSALENNNADIALISKIGRAFVTTHDYAKAVAYYENAVRENPGTSLRYDLAELYTKLRKFDQAEALLKSSLDKSSDPSDALRLISDVKVYNMMAKVHMGSGNFQKGLEALQKAKETQVSVLGRLQGEQPDFIKSQKEQAALICFAMAQHFNSQNNIDRAMTLYHEALKYNEGHEPSILALARLYLAKGDLDPCQHQCITLLRMDAGNEEASMMLADLMFRKNEYDAATFHFSQLLERKPNHYVALARLIHLMRRAGKLNDIPRFLKLATDYSKRSTMDTGLHYCRGLYYRYVNNAREALSSFYEARKDPRWGESVLTHMIEIYINPDNEIVSIDPEGGLSNSQATQGDHTEQLKAIASAKELLRELPNNPKSLKTQVLEAYVMMAGKGKTDIDDAMNHLNNVLNIDKNYVPALLAVSECFIIRKDAQKARNQLKTISKMPHNSDEAEEFERSWILLSDIYIQVAKYDMASELLRRCLSYNKSCPKAWELLGFIMEKEQAFRDASDHYECSWKMQNESNPTLGFRLAFNYLKAKRYVEAIDVCHKVLALYPDYPKIRKEILEKARSSLRSDNWSIVILESFQMTSSMSHLERFQDDNHNHNDHFLANCQQSHTKQTMTVCDGEQRDARWFPLSDIAISWVEHHKSRSIGNPNLWKGLDICDVTDYVGVTCDSAGYPTRLELSFQSFSGVIPSNIDQLKNLTYISLRNNFQLHGSIPDTIGNLSQLRYLDVGVTGVAGVLPLTISRLSQLQHLDTYLASNLGGDITVVTSITSLNWLELGKCNFSGSIPTSIGSLTKLSRLSLWFNNIVGTIPTSMGNLTSLTYLDLGHNQLTGSIPLEIGSLSGLTFLSFWTNNITGIIPPSIGNLTHLTYLDLSYNYLTGSFPPSFTRLPTSLSSLSYLNLGNNQLTGSIPLEIGSLSGLTYLSFWKNNIAGIIPPSIGNLTHLTYLDLGYNRLTGSFPLSFTRLTQLNQLDMAHNALNGSAPNLSLMTQLSAVSFSGLNLTGTLNVTGLQLTGLYVDGNQFDAVITQGFTMVQNNSCNMTGNAFPCYPLLVNTGDCILTYLPCTNKDEINMLYDNQTRLSAAGARTLLNASRESPTELVRGLAAVSAALLRNTSSFSYEENGVTLFIRSFNTSQSEASISSTNGSFISADIPTSIIGNNQRVAVSLSTIDINPFYSIQNDIIYSPVVGVEIYDRNANEILIVRSQEKINISMGYNLSIPSDHDAVCQYWNETERVWGRDGCSLFIQKLVYICQCDHLTNFSIGAFPRQNPPTSLLPEVKEGGPPIPLFVIIIIAAVVGGLIIIVAALILFKVIRRRKVTNLVGGARDTVGDIQYVERLSAGDRSQVWKAINNATTTVVVKKRDERWIRKQAQEAARLKSLHHPNIIMFLGQSLDDGSLSTYSRSHSISPLLYTIGVDIARAMSYVTEQNIVHTQITPQHVLLRVTEGSVTVKLTGFSESVEDKTTYEAPLGFHTAPEVRRYGTQYLQSDVWSFGLLLFFMANGGREHNQIDKPMVEREWDTSVKALIQDCAEEEMNDRPKFRDIVSRLRRNVRSESVMGHDEIEDKQDYYAGSKVAYIGYCIMTVVDWHYSLRMSQTGIMPRIVGGITFEHDDEVAVQLMGNSDSGITSLMVRFVPRTFSKTKNVKSGEMMYKLEITRDRSVAPYNPHRQLPKATVVVYDVTSPESLSSVRGYHRELDRYISEQAPRFLFANKIDKKAERVVSSEEGKAIAEELGLIYWEVSAATGENVQRAFEDVVNRIYRRGDKPTSSDGACQTDPKSHPKSGGGGNIFSTMLSKLKS